MSKIKEENSFRDKRSFTSQKKGGKRSSFTDFDRYSRDDKSSSYTGWSSSELADETANIKEETQIINMPTLVDLDSFLDETKVLDVVVSAVANPSVFWIQIPTFKGENKKLNEFNQKMTTFYTQNNAKNIFYVRSILFLILVYANFTEPTLGNNLKFRKIFI